MHSSTNNVAKGRYYQFGEVCDCDQLKYLKHVYLLEFGTAYQMQISDTSHLHNLDLGPFLGPISLQLSQVIISTRLVLSPSPTSQHPTHVPSQSSPSEWT